MQQKMTDIHKGRYQCSTVHNDTVFDTGIMSLIITNAIEICSNVSENKRKCGGRSKVRTYDPLIKSQLLCQLSSAPRILN